MLACPLPPDEALRQQALDDMALVDTPAEHYLDALVELARETFGVKTVLISLIDHDRQWFKARIGLDAEQTPRDLSFCGHAILASEPLMVTDASRDPRFHDNPLVTGPLHPLLRRRAPARQQWPGHRHTLPDRPEPAAAESPGRTPAQSTVDPGRRISPATQPHRAHPLPAPGDRPGAAQVTARPPHPIVEPGRLPRAAPA